MLDYNLDQYQFKEVHQITSLNGKDDVGIENLAFSSNGQYATITLHSSASDYRTDEMLLKLMDDSELLLSSLLRHTAVKMYRWIIGMNRTCTLMSRATDRRFYYKWDALTGKQHLL
ncbi:hypothetical protein [Paenibacillus sp. TY11]|uniref:hypothetical protein n=1 Tax=Paenibacillus sp. TY11 TaxID=3448633 RepID=UPI004039F8C8